jgi:hypothetical protein
MTFFLGLDLGQAQDPTAIAVLERHEPPPLATEPDPFPYSARGVRVWGPDLSAKTPQPQPRYHCRYLERLQLGTPYPSIAAHVKKLLNTLPLRNRTTLIVDATGVGRPVVDMLRQQKLEPVAITITGGDLVTYDKGWRVPKRDLVASVAVLLQSERLEFAEQLPLVPLLVRELLAFRVKIDPLTAHDSYGAWREGSHDDMVLALAVAAWYAQERWQPPQGDYKIAPIGGLYERGPLVRRPR